MKKTSVLLLGLLFVSCGVPKNQLKIYNWEGYIPKEIYAEFEKETGISVVLDNIASNEELYAKVQSAGSVYDLIVVSSDYAKRLFDEGLTAPIESENISNIDPNIRVRLSDIDPTGTHVIPYAYAPTVIAYDSEKVTEPVRGYEIYENPKYKGQMTLLDDMREIMSAALLISNYAVDSTNIEALNAATAQIRRWKENILRFDADSFQKSLADGETLVVQGYPETIWGALGERMRQTVKFVIPEKGAFGYIDSFILLKNASNKEAAYAFVNFIHRPDVYARICDSLRMLCINVPAQQLIKEKPLFAYEALSNMTLLEAVSDEVLATQSRVWEEILAE